MEELRSTRVLDREILEDARKKAHKILKTADDALAAQSRSREKKIQRALNSIRKTYEERVKKNREEIFARLPLDKRRIRSETSERFLIKAMDDFLRSLKRETLFFILERSLAEHLEVCAVNGDDLEAEVQYSGMELSEAKQILKSARFSKYGMASAPLRAMSTHQFPFIEINTKSVKITASVESAADALLKEKRAELAAALLGEGVLND